MSPLTAQSGDLFLYGQDRDARVEVRGANGGYSVIEGAVNDPVAGWQIVDRAYVPTESVPRYMAELVDRLAIMVGPVLRVSGTD